jgi:DNA-binding NarL/FixJ family response regulator
MDGLDACKHISSLYPDVKILVLTIHPEEHFAIRLLKAGALGYITKKVSSDKLHEAVRAVAAGDIFVIDSSKDIILKQLLSLKKHTDLLGALSDRELQVFHLLAQGKKIREIAELLGLSTKTVDNYRSRTLSKLNLKRTVDLVAFAHQHHLI